MKKIRTISILLIMVLMGISSSIAAKDSWKLVMNKKDIQVYTRPAEGCPLDEFMGTTVLNAPIETCARVLRDVKGQTEWMGDCLQSKVLKKFSENHVVAYNVLNGIWPLSDRDLQIDTVFIEDFKAGHFTVKMKVYQESLVPVTKKYVRITDFKATCKLERLDENRTKVIYINRVNPMAPVPSGVANMVVKKNPYKTLLGFKKMIKLDRYREK